MKRFGILVLIFLSIRLNAFAQSQYSPILSKMEKSLFGMDYSAQSDADRVTRIENSVYGAPSSKALGQRVGKLSKDLSADLMGQEIKPKSDTFAQDDDSPQELREKADKSVNYPIVNALEDKVFNKEFREIDVDQRVAKLEQKVFSKNYNDDLSSRVDRLRNAVLPQRVADSDYSDEDSDSGSPPLYPSASPSDIPSYSHDTPDMLSQDAFSGPSLYSRPTGSAAAIPSYNSNNSVLDPYSSNTDITIPLASIEKRVLKQSYPDDTVQNRLSRLEQQIFNSNFEEDDEQARLDRITSAYRAQKSSKRYDGNKFSQHMSTAVQIGAILLMILAAVL